MKKAITLAAAMIIAASAAFPTSAAWYSPEWYYDYYIESDYDSDYFYPESSATIYHDGHGNFTTSGGSIITSDDGFVTVIPPSGGLTQSTSISSYPVAPSSWQGSGNTGTGSYTYVSSIVQNNGVLGTLTIKGQKISAYEGTSDANLLKGAGHFTGTSVWDGNVCFAGHNRGPNAWFYQLINLKPGDVITYQTSLGYRTYVVSNTKVVSVNDTSPLYATNENQLTLVTCIANQPSVRLIVTAKQVY